MSKHKPSSIDWEFLWETDPNAPWPPVPRTATGQAQHDGAPRTRRVVVFSMTLAFLLLMGIGVTYAHHAALKGIDAVEQEVRAVVVADQWLRHEAHGLSADALVDTDTSLYVHDVIAYEQDLLASGLGEKVPPPVLDIQDTWFVGSAAAVRLTLTLRGAEANAPVVYRQTRFYHETDRGWLRTQPSPALWGESRTLQTDHLLWQYRRQDEAAVVAIAERMDALYTQLQRDYGLAQSFEHERQVIDVRVERVPGKTSTVLSPSKAITVPSPAVYLAPTELTAADILAQSVALAIAKSTWSQAVLQQDMRSRKDAQSTNELLGSLISGMALWQLWNSGLALSEWQNDVVQWVFADVPRLSAEASTGLPARYHELCAAHNIFMVSPVTIGIPLYCDGRDRNLVMTSLLSVHAEKLTSFGEPKTGRYDSYHDIGAVRLAHTLTMFTVIDYAVTQYGRERLPDLVAALGRYDSWETLVPSVYGVSLDEFEEGWRQHVARLVQ